MFSTPSHGESPGLRRVREGTFFDFFSGSVRAPNRSRITPPGARFLTLREGVRDPPWDVPDGVGTPSSRGHPGTLPGSPWDPHPGPWMPPGIGVQDPPGQGPGWVLGGGTEGPGSTSWGGYPRDGGPWDRVRAWPGTGSQGRSRAADNYLVRGWLGRVLGPSREGPGRGRDSRPNPSWAVPG